MSLGTAAGSDTAAVGRSDAPSASRLWPSGPIIWFRPSIRRVVWRLWGLAALWVALGAACLGALRVMRVDFGSAWLPLYALGLGLVTAGPWQLFAGLQRATKVERVLSVHDEGVRWQDGATFSQLRWSELDHIDVAEQSIVIHGDPPTGRIAVPGPLEGMPGPDLAAMLMDMRKKALLGLPVRLTPLPDRS